MIRARTLVPLLVALLSACGGEITEPLNAVFPLGPKQVRLALLERFPDTLTPESTVWPETASALQVDLEVVRSAPLDLSAKDLGFAGQALKSWPALVGSSMEQSPVESIDLFVGPADAAGIEDERVHLVAHGAVPRDRKSTQPLVWTEVGPQQLTRALEGKTLVLFARGRIPVQLTPGQPLPGGDAEGGVGVQIPLRYGP